MLIFKSILFFIFTLVIMSDGFSNYSRFTSRKNIKFRTNFGKCPSRTAGILTLKLMKSFERNNSLKDVKLKIVREKLDEKHFLSSYKLSYNPLKTILNFKFDCPKPLMKVQIYKKSGIESYEAILVDNGQLYDPTYEILLRNEGKLKRNLPFLAIPVGEMEKDIQSRMTKLVNDMGNSFRKKLSEIIISKEKEITIILSLTGRPSSVFLGKEGWSDKVLKLRKIVKYMEKRKKIPAIINLTNSQKVVVKFSDKF